MSRVPVLVAFALSVALVAAAPPKPRPTPAPPAPSAAPAPVLPIVVVYPFQVSSDLQANTGMHAAQLFVEQMNAAGGVDAILAPASVIRAQYLTYAHGLNADYYVTGYMTPLGTGVSLVEQLVSTQAGAIVYGTTAQIESFQDAASQAVAIRDGIVQREQGMRAALDQSAQTTPAPAASNQTSINIGGLFKHRGRATPAPVVAVLRPSKGMFVGRVTGALPASSLAQATSDLISAANAHYIVRPVSAAGSLARQANSICGSARDNTVADGTLRSATVRHGFFSRVQYTFTLNVYTCFGVKLASSAGTSDSIASAVNAAVAAYAAAHPLNG